MHVSVEVGDVFEHSGDVLICPANPWLNMSGGVNGEILLRCGMKIQTELHSHLASWQAKQVKPTTVIRTSAGVLDYQHILHAVAIDVFYDADKAVVKATLMAAWAIAATVGATAVMPAIATGYGRLPFPDFFLAFREAYAASNKLDIRLTLVLRHEDQRRQFNDQFVEA